MPNIRAFLCAALAAASAASSAHATNVVTYTINASGYGTRVSDDDRNPENGFDFSNLVGSVLTFSIPLPNTSGVVFGSTVNGVFDVSTVISGLGFSFESPPFTPGAIIGSGNVCFNNPDASFPTANVVLSRGAGCNVVSYSKQGSTSREEFSGVIDSINVSVAEGIDQPLASVTGVVPEPTTWALMLAGFGMVGYALRRRPRLSYAA